MPAARPDPFETFYSAHFQEIAAYIRRRVPAGDADDVTAQVFTVAWRRFGSVPGPPQGRLWLFGVARNCVAEHDRSARRRSRLHARLSAEALAGTPDGAEPGTLAEPVRAAISALRPRDREALLLVLWDGLSQAEAATVLECSPNAVEHRYRRARAAVRAALGTVPGRGATPARGAIPGRGTAPGYAHGASPPPADWPRRLAAQPAAAAGRIQPLPRAEQK